MDGIDYEERLAELIENVFSGETPTDTEINDYVWHDRSIVYRAIGLDENGRIPEGEDGEEEEDGEDE